MISKQAYKLNTNTRYLHPNYISLAKELSCTLPDGLEVVFFTNSGSEANDLALRIAMCYNSIGNMIVVDGGYHGHTLGTLQVSPYKFEKSGEPFVKNKQIVKVPVPSDKQDAEYHAKLVQDACAELDNNVTAMIIEGGMSVGE